MCFYATSDFNNLCWLSSPTDFCQWSCCTQNKWNNFFETNKLSTRQWEISSTFVHGTWILDGISNYFYCTEKKSYISKRKKNKYKYFIYFKIFMARNNRIFAVFVLFLIFAKILRFLSPSTTFIHLRIYNISFLSFQVHF